MVDWVHLRLDVDEFDDGVFEPYLRRARGLGIGFTTMAELGDTADHRRALYELNKTCSADIPDRGEFYSYDDYVDPRDRRRRVDRNVRDIPSPGQGARVQ